MKIILMTSGRVNYILPGHNLYESMRLTSGGKRFPHIISGIDEIKKAVNKMNIPDNIVILSAPSNQAKETARIIGKLLGSKVIEENKFIALKFDLRKILSEEEFNRSGKNVFNILRSRFLDAFFEDRLIDRQVDFKKRYMDFILDIKENYSDKNIIVLSHAYLIQLFFIYNQIGDLMFSDRKKLRKLFEPSKPFGFLKKIEIDIGYN